MTGAEIVRRKKAEIAEKYKDDPPGLERQNFGIDAVRPGITWI